MGNLSVRLEGELTPAVSSSRKPKDKNTYRCSLESLNFPISVIRLDIQMTPAGSYTTICCMDISTFKWSNEAFNFSYH